MALSQLPRNVKVITATRVLGAIGFSSTIPFLALYLAVERSTPLEVVGAMYLLQAVAGLGSQVVSGLISDRIGARRTYLLGNAFAAAAALYMAAVIALNVTPILIVLTYPAFSLFRGFMMPAGSALVADEKTDLVNNFSLLTMAGNVGFALGPAAGGFIVSYVGYDSLFLFSAVLSVVSLVVSTSLHEGTYHLAKEKESARPDLRTLVFVLLTFCGYVVVGQDIEPFALYAGQFAGISNLAIGYLFSFSGVMIVVLQIPMMNLFRRRRRHTTIVISTVTAIVSFVLLYFSRTEGGFLASMAVLTLTEILFIVPSQIWITEASPPSRKGAYQGYYGAARSAGRSSAAWLGSTLQGAFYAEPQLTWVAMGCLAAATGVGFALHGKTDKASPVAV